MELCPTFKIGKKYHPDFAEVPSCQVKIVVRILPVMRSSARLIFQGPLSYPCRAFYSQTGGRRYNLPVFAIVIFYRAPNYTVILKKKGSLPLGIMHLILDKRKIGLGLGHKELGFKSLFCQMHPAKPSRHNHLKCCCGSLWEYREGGQKWGREKEMRGTRSFSYASWKSLRNHSWDQLLRACPTRLLVMLSTTLVS